MFRLYDYQIDAINRLQNGSILCGGVGSGKSLTAIGYYYLQQGGSIAYLTGEKVVKMKKPKDLYIITTARKRDDFEWEGELHHFLMSSKPEENYYKNKIVIDSWNNIQKYRDVEDAFFIFDEQRVVGYGAWAKAFIKIARSNMRGVIIGYYFLQHQEILGKTIWLYLLLMDSIEIRLNLRLSILYIILMLSLGKYKDI